MSRDRSRARLVALLGKDALPPARDTRTAIAEEVEEFGIGTRRDTAMIDHVLSTVLFTDIVASTKGG